GCSVRNGAAPVCRTEQPVLEPQSECARFQPAGCHLPVRPEPLQGLAEPCLDRSINHHFRGACAEHRCPHPSCPEKIVMTVAAITVPTVTHALSQDENLVEKVSVRNLDFFYGDHRALKSISVPLYHGKVTAFIGPSGGGESTLLRRLNRIH